MSRGRRFRAKAATAAAAGLVLLAAVSCGGGSPSTSTPPAPVAPQPSASPTPTGGDPFNHSSCPLGKGEANAKCSEARSSLLAQVESAMDLLIQQRPQLFDLNDDAGSRAYKVKDRDGYMDGLVGNLRAAGLCAERDPDDGAQETIRVKSASDFSENFDVLLGSGHMRRGAGAYRATCSPANFPVERGTDAPPIGSGCGRPYPPVVTRFACKVHLKSNEFYTLDSTPQVGPDAEYCYAIGFTDGRTICPLRPEDWADRAACENWRVGKAKDTGRLGPTWRRADGSFCTGPDSGCANHPDNQYQLFTYRSGSYTVSAENGAYCTVSH